MEDKVFQAALAGLLHDIGKIEQRARDDPWKPPEGCEDTGQPVHAAWSLYFIEHHVQKAHRSAAIHAAYHHQPEKSPASDAWLSRIVALADKLSAGERADDEQPDKDLPQQLVSIYDRVSVTGTAPPPTHYLPLKSLALHEAHLFPTGQLAVQARRDAYTQLRDELRQAAGQEIGHPQAYLENLLSAMQRAAWCVPSAYYHNIPDVSLYDHCRMTAALAVCLLELPESERQALLEAVEAVFKNKATPAQKTLLERPVACLVGGDISGIQDFIYTISSKGAARMLRGRSFYLHLLTEAMLRYVLRASGLPYTNVIYSGGGHFYLLAPPSLQARLPALQAEVSKKLYAAHQTALYLAIGSAPVPASGLRVGQFQQYWGEMHRAIGIAKQRRYTELQDNQYQTIFAPPEHGGNPAQNCAICGGDDLQVTKWDELEEQDRICSLCKSFAEELGKDLPRARFIALGHAEPQSSKLHTAKDILASFGLQVRFLSSAQEQIDLPGADFASLWALQDPKDDQWPQPAIPAARSVHYTVNQTPGDTFDDLQKKANGFKRLGVLRLDVDNLGEIFSHGLGERATLARLSTLSFQTSLFFEGWVKALCAEGEYRELIYTVYAGGDDVFVLGPWDRIPTLAQRIAKDFQRYTAGNPDLHLSGGMAFIGGKYPIYQAADDAGEALEQAKDTPGKNAFTFLGESWKWTEFDQLAEKQALLREMASDREMGGKNALLQNLRQLAGEQARQVKEKGKQPQWGPWRWLGAYQLKRATERAKESALKEKLQAINQSLETNLYTDLPQWGIAARWAQLILRKPSSKGE